MPLQWQNIDVPIVGGIDTRSDDRLLPATKLSTLKNAYWVKKNKVAKRPGFAAQYTDIFGGGSISSGRSLHKHKDERLQVSGSTLYADSDTANKWVSKGTLEGSRVSLRSIQNSSSGKSDYDVAAVNGYEVHAWKDGRGGVRATVIDQANGTSVLSDVQISTQGNVNALRCVVVGNYIFIFYEAIAYFASVPTYSPTIYGVRFNTSSPTSFGAETTVQAVGSDASGFNFSFDACTFTSTKAIIAYTTGVGSIILKEWRDDNTAGGTASYTPAAGQIVGGTVHVTVAANSDIYTFWAERNSGHKLYVFVRSSVLALRYGATLIDTDTLDGGASWSPYRRLTSAWETSTRLRLFYEIAGLDADLDRDGSNQEVLHTNIKTVTVEESGGVVVIGTPAFFRYRCQLASQAWVYSSTTYLTVMFVGNRATGVDPLQPTYFVMKADGSYVAKLFAGRARGKVMATPQGTGLHPGQVANVVNPSSGKYAFPVFLASDLTDNSWTRDVTTYFYHPGQLTVPAVGIERVEIDLATAPAVTDFEAEDLAGLNVGRPYQYDGRNLTELGFDVFPEKVEQDASTMSISVTQQGTAGLPEITNITFPGADRILPNQSFTIVASGGTVVTVVFLVDSEDTYLSAANTIYAKILSTDTPTQVATKVASAIDAHPSFIATSSGAVVTVTNAANGAVADAANVNVGTVQPSGTAMSNGTYGYVAVYEWVDAVGGVHRSAPSPSLSITLSGGTSTQYVSLGVPSLEFTKKTGAAGEVQISIYRTVNNGTVYYKVFSQVSGANIPILNRPTSEWTYFTDTNPDSNITSNEILYTSGGILENIAPPMAAYVHNHQRRPFVLPLEAPNELWVGKSKEQGQGLSFSDFLVLVMDATGGRGVALGSIDDKVIILKESACLFTSGEGPDNTGANQFPKPEFISREIGCDDPLSVISHPGGLLFRSKKGWYLIDRGLQLQYVGAAVDDYKDLTISSARHIEDMHHIRITHTDGVTLVFDYEFNEWATYSNCEAVGSVYQSNLWQILKSTGVVWQETPGVYQDPSSTEIVPEIETAWIKLQNLQGFQRVRRASLLGTFPTGYTYRVTEKIDYKDTVVGTMDYTPANVNEVQDIDFSAVPDSGTWTISIDSETTASLAFDANAATVESALEALTGIVSVTVSGDYTNGFSVTFDGGDGATDQSIMSVSDSLTSGGEAVTVSVAETTKGEAIEDDQFEVKFDVQKCEAMKIKLSQSGTGIYNAWEFEGFTLEAGMKKGLHKMRPSAVAT